MKLALVSLAFANVTTIVQSMFIGRSEDTQFWEQHPLMKECVEEAIRSPTRVGNGTPERADPRWTFTNRKLRIMDDFLWPIFPDKSLIRSAGITDQIFDIVYCSEKEFVAFALEADTDTLYRKEGEWKESQELFNVPVSGFEMNEPFDVESQDSDETNDGDEGWAKRKAGISRKPFELVLTVRVRDDKGNHPMRIIDPLSLYELELLSSPDGVMTNTGVNLEPEPLDNN